jgi:hypothetical protein
MALRLGERLLGYQHKPGISSNHYCIQHGHIAEGHGYVLVKDGEDVYWACSRCLETLTTHKAVVADPDDAGKCPTRR